jgi:hypothetical protein
MTTPMTVNHIGPGTPDTYHNVSRVITSTETFDGYLEPVGEVLHLDEQNTAVITHQIVLPPDAALHAGDQIVANGVTYQVLEALKVTNARTGVAHHVEGRVQEQTG